MQDNSSAFYKRVGALGAATALAVSGAFIASPAIAAPAAEPDTTAPTTAIIEAPADETVSEETVVEETITDEVAPAEEAPAFEAVTLPPGLAEALLRDLGMTVEEFEAAGELGQKAAAALAELQATEGFVSIAIEDEKIVITGSGEALEALALKLDAVLVAPAVVAKEPNVTETPAAEASETPSAEASEAAEEPVAEADKATPVSLPVNRSEAIAALSARYIANVGVQGLQSILWDGSSYVISVDQTAVMGDSVFARGLAEVADTPAEALAEQYENVIVADSSGATTPLEEVVNAQGYASPMGGGSYATCSIGFNGFNGDGEPAVISAGHCAHDGAADKTVLSDPTGDDASGTPSFGIGSDLGTWGFNQFGGADNSPVDPETGANFGTDIGAIDKINSDLDLLPEVTEWKNAEDLTANTVKITGTTEPVIGAPVCKSGRTTGWSCGTVTATDVLFLVGGHDYPADPDDIRGVKGFESTLEVNASPGDSGGSVISGSLAMGITSAGGMRDGIDRHFSTLLSDGLNHLPGYTVAVFVETPKLTSHKDNGTVLTDEAIRGTATGTAVKLTLNGETTDLLVENGAWSFKAPSTVPADDKKLKFTVQAVNGFNKSKAASYELTVKEAKLDAPVITNPAAGAQIADSLTTITGTGVPNAEVTVDIAGMPAADKSDSAETAAAIEEPDTATVDAKGNWEYKLDEALSYGDYTVTATQDGIAGKLESPMATSDFAVFLSAPAITTITEGQEFVEGEHPTEIAGTGIAGAELDVTIGETTLNTTVADNGSWSVNGFPALAPGIHTVSAVQMFAGETSASTDVAFTVTAVVIEEQAPPVVPPAPAPDNNGDGLPDTGVAGMGLFVGAGALLTAGGISALLINRRRQMQDA